MPTVRRLAAREWREYRDLRLRALADAPDAFGSTLERERERADADWAERLAADAGSAWCAPLVAEDGGRPVGLVWGRIDPAAPGTAHVFQMWVAPESRGRGAGALLLDAVVAWARGAGAARVALGVTRGDSAARRLYERAGFRADGAPAPLRPGAALLSQPMRLDLAPPAAARALAFVAARSSGEPVDPALRVTLNFHPDRLRDGVPILRELADDGVYRSQFETGTSNGGLSARPGGSRWRWESRMFGGAYDEAPAAERPKYGALNYRRRATGGSPRFGSAHLRLRPGVLPRCTFCYPDSSAEPRHFGVASRMALVPRATAEARDPLDDHVEAQVHGPLRLDDDVEALVLDPCYRGTEVEALARALPCPTEWHPGFRLHLDVLRAHPDFRGPRIVELGQALARDGYLTPHLIGEAARTGHHDPQELKKVWHYLARFGDLSRPG